MSKIMFSLVYKMASLLVFLFSVQLFNIVLASHSVEDLSQHKNYHLLPSRCGSTRFGRMPTCVRPRVKDGFCKAQPGQFPWMAKLYIEDKNFQLFDNCAGSIINDRYILTAAHCVQPLSIGTRYVVLVGEIHGTKHCKISQGRCYDVESVVLHEKYGRKLHPYQRLNENDIALLRLSHRIDFSSDNVSPICLPLNLYPNLDGEFTVAGWGFINAGKPRATTLKYDNVPHRATDSCGYLFGGITADLLENYIICAGDHRGSSKGDSGGPLMKGYQNPQRGIINYILGIVSGGPMPYEPYDPLKSVVYTRVTSFLPWILDNIRE